MEAIILAGGFGTRLKPLTYTRAKSLLPILNKPMISYLIESLPDDIDKIILAVNYKKNQIENYFKNNDFGKKIIINDEPRPLGTGGAVKFAERHLTGRFLVLNSDIISSIDLNKMLEFHRRNNAVASISLWPVENVSEFGVVNVKDNWNITDFVEKPKPEDAPSNLINAGAYCLEPEVLDYIETDRLVSMEKEIFPQIIKNTGRFFGFRFEGYWMDIGRISSYIEVNKFFLVKKKLKSVKGEKCNISGVLNESCVGNNVVVGKNSVIDSCVIYDNVVIQENTYLSNCVIGENCRIGGFSKIVNSVVGDNEILPDNSNINDEILCTQPVPNGYPKKQIGNVLKR